MKQTDPGPLKWQEQKSKEGRPQIPLDSLICTAICLLYWKSSQCLLSNTIVSTVTLWLLNIHIHLQHTALVFGYCVILSFLLMPHCLVFVTLTSLTHYFLLLQWINIQQQLPPHHIHFHCTVNYQWVLILFVLPDPLKSLKMQHTCVVL